MLDEQDTDNEFLMEKNLNYILKDFTYLNMKENVFPETNVMKDITQSGLKVSFPKEYTFVNPK